MKGQGFHRHEDVVLTVEVVAINGSTMSGQSEWCEISVVKSDGTRGVVRIEKIDPPIETLGTRRIRL